MRSVNKEIGILNGYFDGADQFDLENSLDILLAEYLDSGDLFEDDSFLNSNFFSINKEISYH